MRDVKEHAKLAAITLVAFLATVCAEARATVEKGTPACLTQTK
jgi:hypothetical protein